MSPRQAGDLSWWTTRAVLPIAALGALAIALGASSFDRASLVPFFDVASGSFPLRRAWFFDEVLHVAGKWIVVTCTAALVFTAAIGWRSPRWGRHARRSAYLAACLLVTVSITGTWKDLADPVTPWDTVGFGGAEPWPGTSGARSAWDVLGSPGAHASSGFAWMSLYFVGASLASRQRWLWLAPGLVLGLLFALGQHVRGAHPPSHEAWSIAVAWGVACALAATFRRCGWLPWSEVPSGSHPGDALRTEKPEPRDPALPWLVGCTAALLGVSYFALDQVMNRLEAHFPEAHDVFEVTELTVMALGLGVAAWLLTDKIGDLRVREARRAEAERERRLQMLGRLAASVAHEVRNPLQTVRLIVDEQRHEVPGLREHPLQAEFESSLERIDRAVDLVYRLARPESGESEHADLAQAARESVVALLRIHPGRVSFEWDHEPPSAVVGSSRSALRIVIDNLLRNAAEASPPGGTVRLELSARGGDWVLRIVNRGHLRARTRSSGHEPGLGLGVPISRQIANDAGGGIDMVEADGFVTCTLRWPRKAESIA